VFQPITLEDFQILHLRSEPMSSHKFLYFRSSHQNFSTILVLRHVLARSVQFFLPAVTVLKFLQTVNITKLFSRHFPAPSYFLLFGSNIHPRTVFTETCCWVYKVALAQSFLLVLLFSPVGSFPAIVFILILLLPEGQTGESCEPSNKECSFGPRGTMDKKQFHFVPFAPLISYT